MPLRRDVKLFIETLYIRIVRFEICKIISMHFFFVTFQTETSASIGANFYIYVTHFILILHLVFSKKERILPYF